jgi:hypothetical protein
MDFEGPSVRADKKNAKFSLSANIAAAGWFPMRLSDSSMGGDTGQFQSASGTLVTASAHDQRRTIMAALRYALIVAERRLEP